MRPKSVKLARTLNDATRAAIDRQFPIHSKSGKRRKYKVEVVNGVVDDRTLAEIQDYVNSRP